jgi:hypothetical protein
LCRAALGLVFCVSPPPFFGGGGIVAQKQGTKTRPLLFFYSRVTDALVVFLFLYFIRKPNKKVALSQGPVAVAGVSLACGVWCGSGGSPSSSCTSSHMGVPGMSGWPCLFLAAGHRCAYSFKSRRVLPKYNEIALRKPCSHCIARQWPHVTF